MDDSLNTLKWSAQLRVAPSNRRLVGDKITLPQSALEGLLAAAPIVNIQNGSSRNLTSTFDPFNPYSYDAERNARLALSDRQQQLPHPLTFRLVNLRNGRAVYAGIREFSAEEKEVGLSNFLREALGLQDDSSSSESTRESTPSKDVVMTNGAEPEDLITVHARQLPKGTYVRLRPLEPGYDPEDWKSLLERYLRENFTTLTNGEILNVQGARHEHFRFLVDKFEPAGEGICIVDTDLEVDIEPLNEEQARESLSRLLAKKKRPAGAPNSSSSGGAIEVGKEIRGQIISGDYVDYQLKQWDRTQDVVISLETDDENVSLDILASPFTRSTRSLPRKDEYVFGDLSNRPSKRLKLSHTNIHVEDAELINIAVQAWHDPASNTTVASEPTTFTMTVSTDTSSLNGAISDEPDLSPEEVVCKNCNQHIPKRTLSLHEAFCYRNNIRCQKCSTVFLRNSEAWKTHWHCPHDEEYGNGDLSRSKHDSIFHPSSPIQCPGCDFQGFNFPILAQHRTTDCPSKDILCQFCHLIVPQQGPDDPSFTDPEVFMSGLTPHELVDGSRTTECHICHKIVRLRDMKVHTGFHDRERITRPRPIICVNTLCGRSIKPGDELRAQKEQLGLCNDCFGPLYVTTYDPEGKALRRRIERRILQQLIGGCGKSWCRNEDWCKTGRKNVTKEEQSMTAKDALPIIKPIMDQLVKGDSTGLRFCVDETSQTRRNIAEMMKTEGEYELEWYVKALEEEKGDAGKARDWLSERAPRIGEVVR